MGDSDPRQSNSELIIDYQRPNFQPAVALDDRRLEDLAAQLGHLQLHLASLGVPHPLVSARPRIPTCLASLIARLRTVDPLLHPTANPRGGLRLRLPINPLCNLAPTTLTHGVLKTDNQGLVDWLRLERRNIRPRLHVREEVKTPGRDVRNARPEAEAEQVTECKDVLGNTAPVGVMALDREIGARIKPAIKDMQPPRSTREVRLAVLSRFLTCSRSLTLWPNLAVAARRRGG